MIPDESIDCVVSNCVLNLVRPEDRRQLFVEIFRVLRLGGRVAISDIVADEDVPDHLQNEPELWSGCVSGAFREDRFLTAFEDAGFYGIRIAARQFEPWRTVEGIEFRSITVVAHKGKQGPCLERNQAVVYRGPFKKVEDDDEHVYYRGERMAVCDKTFRLLQKEPYAGQFEFIEPREAVSWEEANRFDCSLLLYSGARSLHCLVANGEHHGKSYATQTTPTSAAVTDDPVLQDRAGCRVGFSSATAISVIIPTLNEAISCRRP